MYLLTNGAQINLRNNVRLLLISVKISLITGFYNVFIRKVIVL